ncbi:glycoside hydrolase family 15 protein [Haloimpatiens sp. FM7330]|uniref:glycoside hydrolase family 15 protein n=1 Tax=Haloimpatiens sp. FM7330 TaxID=3298610 RepID=UPI003635348E
MNKKSYLIDGIIGNSKMLLSMYNDGRISRMWWPSIDFIQHVDEILDGVYVKDSDEFLWRKGEQWKYTQEYIENTNILKSTAFNSKYQIEMESIDFCTAQDDVLVKKYTIRNKNSKPLALDFMFYSNLSISDSDRYNSVYFDKNNSALIHYKHEYNFSIGSCNKINGYTVGDAKAQVESGSLNGIEISQGTQGALSFELETLKPGEEKEISIFIAAGLSNEKSIDELNRAKNAGVEKIYNETVDYWNEYVKKGVQVSTGNKEIDEIYVRSLLVVALMYNKETGAYLAAPEFDEDFTKCGGYGFCWPRDGAFIAYAMLKAGYKDMSKQFFEWAIRVQEKEGCWEQRYYMDGLKAPTWGLQIDETGSVLWGMNEYFKETEDVTFIEKAWDSIYKGAEFLCNNIDEETKLPKASMDLWEERKAEHTYSSCAVEAGLRGAAKIAEKLGHSEVANKWLNCANVIKESIEEILWNEEKQSFYRGVKINISKEEYDELKKSNDKVDVQIRDNGYEDYTKYYDDIVDSSLVGANYPFGTINANDMKMIKTGEAVERYLWVNKVGGLKRYEDDPYIGGNPWIITTLWLALYYNRINKVNEVDKLVKWAVNHKTPLNLLPEQIDKESGKTAWVVPLTWSHAMFILTAIEICKIN